MKIQYIAASRMPTEKAHGLQIMKMCEAYAKLGHSVELIIPTRKNKITEDSFAFYDVPRLFTITTLFATEFADYGKMRYWLHRLTFGISALAYIYRTSSDLIHGRDEFSLFLISFLKRKYVFEEHQGRWNFCIRRIAHAGKHLVVTTNGLKDFFISRGVPNNAIHVAADAVDFDVFAQPEKVDTVRASLSIPNSTPLVMYTGHLYQWKGVDVLAEAMKELPHAVCVFIGGTEKDIVRFKAVWGAQKNLMILGHKPYKEIPRFVQAADVLVVPNSAREAISRLYTSPMKLFEYMASGRPIVISDLPSMREVLSEKEAYFAKPDDAHDLARALSSALIDPEARARTAYVQAKAKEYSWGARAQAILSVL